jgi:hypothetical protein
MITSYSTVTVRPAVTKSNAVNTPAALSSFAPTAIKSACRLKVSPVTTTSVVWSYVTATATIVSVATVTASPQKNCYTICNNRTLAMCMYGGDGTVLQNVLRDPNDDTNSSFIWHFDGNVPTQSKAPLNIQNVKTGGWTTSPSASSTLYTSIDLANRYAWTISPIDYATAPGKYFISNTDNTTATTSSSSAAATPVNSQACDDSSGSILSGVTPNCIDATGAVVPGTRVTRNPGATNTLSCRDKNTGALLPNTKPACISSVVISAQAFDGLGATTPGPLTFGSYGSNNPSQVWKLTTLLPFLFF